MTSSIESNDFPEKKGVTRGYIRLGGFILIQQGDELKVHVYSECDSKMKAPEKMLKSNTSKRVSEYVNKTISSLCSDVLIWNNKL